jgi:hypothetical protein
MATWPPPMAGGDAQPPLDLLGVLFRLDIGF